MFVRALHIAFCLVVSVCFQSGSDDHFRLEASEAVIGCQGCLLLFADVHPCPVRAVCGEVTLVVDVKLPSWLLEVSRVSSS